MFLSLLILEIKSAKYLSYSRTHIHTQHTHTHIQTDKFSKIIFRKSGDPKTNKSGENSASKILIENNAPFT